MVSAASPLDSEQEDRRAWLLSCRLAEAVFGGRVGKKVSGNLVPASPSVASGEQLQR